MGSFAGFAENFFRSSVAIDIGSVEEVYSFIQRCTYDGFGLCSVDHRAQAIATQTDCADQNRRVGETSLAYGSTSSAVRPPVHRHRSSWWWRQTLSNALAKASIAYIS